MTNKAQITQQAARDGVPATTVERDYVLAHIIAGLATLNIEHGLVFKGGTALRLCFFENYRYSADLDFSLTHGTKQDAYDVVQLALDSQSGAITALSLTDQEPIRITYQGPLGRERTLKLDIAEDELVLDAQSTALLPRWGDLPKDAALTTYSLTEIAGEKLRCIMQRLQCRDLFDLALLFDDAQVDPRDAADIFIPKAQHRDLDPRQFAERYTKRVAQYQKRWDRELSEHVPGAVPEFNDLERRIARRLRSAGLL